MPTAKYDIFDGDPEVSLGPAEKAFYDSITQETIEAERSDVSRHHCLIPCLMSKVRKISLTEVMDSLITAMSNYGPSSEMVFIYGAHSGLWVVEDDVETDNEVRSRLTTENNYKTSNFFGGITMAPHFADDVVANTASFSVVATDALEINVARGTKWGRFKKLIRLPIDYIWKGRFKL